MDESNQNIRLTLVQSPEEDSGEIQIDFVAILEGFRRFLALWIAVSVGLGAVALGLSLGIQRTFYVSDAKALIRFSDGGRHSEGSYNDSNAINLFRSPAVVNEALKSMGINLNQLENIRSNITISGFIPDSAYERISMSYNLLEKGGSLDVVEALLGTNYQYDRYLLSFNYQNAGYTREEGVALLNEILTAYREFYDDTYNYSSALGSPVAVIDYTEYDYAEAANIFSSTLDSILSYLSAISSSETTVFRSSETGYTFSDLYRVASTLKDIELDRVSSFIYIHSVTSYDLETEISHYEWLIEQTQQQKNIMQTRFDSLTASIEAYEKDPIIYSVRESSTVAASDTNVNGAYDRMIAEKQSAQEALSQYQSTIEYYESMISRFQLNNPPRQENIATVNGYLVSLNEKVNQLIEDVNATADEYYRKAAFANTLRVLVPATADPIPTVSKTAVLIFIAVEALIFLVYLFQSVAYGLRKSNARRKETPDADGPATDHGAQSAPAGGVPTA